MPDINAEILRQMKNIISVLVTSGNPAAMICHCCRAQSTTAEYSLGLAGAHRPVLKSCVMAFRMLLLVLLLLLPLCAGARVLAKDYMSIVNKTSKSSIKSVMMQADRYLDAGHQDTALVYYMVVCNRMRDDLPESDRLMCAIAYLKKGNVYYVKGGYADALKAYFSGLRICKSCNDKSQIGRFYNNIGNVYCVFNDYEKGLEYYKTAYGYCNKYHDKKNCYKALTNMTGVNTLIGRTAKARKYHSMSEKLMDKSDNVNNFMTHFNLGLILIAEKNYSKAVDTFYGLLGYALKNNMEPRYICSVYKQLYKNYTKLGKRDSTLKYMRLCENTAVRHSILHFCMDVLIDRADFYDFEGDYRLANIYRKRYQRDRDSVFDVHEFEMVKNEQLLYEMDKYDRYISSLNEREKERVLTISAQRRSLAVVTVVAIMIAMLLFVVYRQKKRIDRNYNNLFVINRDFVKNQEIMRHRLLDAVSRLKATEAEADRLRTELSSCGCGVEKSVDDAGGLSDDMVRRSKASVMNDDMRMRLLDSVVDIMENSTEFCSPDFSLARLAALVGSNSKYVSLVINDTFHKSFKNYVNDYRIRLACLRMADTGMYASYTLNAIAESVGFKSYTTFVELFRKVVGITPSMYKDKLRESELEIAADRTDEP